MWAAWGLPARGSNWLQPPNGTGCRVPGCAAGKGRWRHNTRHGHRGCLWAHHSLCRRRLAGSMGLQRGRAAEAATLPPRRWVETWTPGRVVQSTTNRPLATLGPYGDLTGGPSLLRQIGRLRVSEVLLPTSFAGTTVERGAGSPDCLLPPRPVARPGGHAEGRQIGSTHCQPPRCLNPIWEQEARPKCGVRFGGRDPTGYKGCVCC